MLTRADLIALPSVVLYFFTLNPVYRYSPAQLSELAILSPQVKKIMIAIAIIEEAAIAIMRMPHLVFLPFFTVKQLLPVFNRSVRI